VITWDVMEELLTEKECKECGNSLL
jgi:hypothetical protein